MHGPIVELNLPTPIGAQIAERYRRLIAESFAASPGVERVYVSELPGGHAGLSSIAVLLAIPRGARGHAQNPRLIRIGPQARMNEETRRYRAYVEPYLGKNRPRVHETVSVGDLGIATYEYLRDPSKEAGDIPLQTLHSFLDESSTAAASRAVSRLFREMIRQHGHNSVWYSGKPEAAQKPLWFYNTMLPATLELDDVGPARGAPQHDLAAQLEQADKPGSGALHEQRVVLAPGRPFPEIRIVERQQQRDGKQRLRLFCYELAPSPEQVFQPIPQVAARIDLLVSPELAQELITAPLPMKLASPIEGRVVATRHHGFETLLHRRIGGIAVGHADGRIRLGDGQLVNPIDEYQRLLGTPRPLTSSTVHGDMNLGNILLSASEFEDVVSPWLIDFDKTGPGQHAVFDAVKLETEYKTHVLSHKLGDAYDLLALERALFQALNDPGAELDMLRGYPKLSDAYRFLAAVRRSVLVDLQPAIAPAEYYLGLLGYGLAALKYENLYALGKTGAGDKGLFPAARAAYLSAAYAASRIEECDHLRGPTLEWYKEPPLRDVKLKRVVPLVGRERALAQARQLLADPPRIAVLQGRPGSGREAVAMKLLAELEGDGYAIWPWPLSRRELPRIELLTHLLAKNARFRAPPERPAGATLGQWKRRDFIDRTVTWMHSLLESGRLLNSKRVALLLDLGLADEELRDLVAALCATLEQTQPAHIALLIITDERIDELEQRSVRIDRFGEAEVRAYVTMRQFALDDATVARLAEACHGMPNLLKIFFDQARAVLATDRNLTIESALEQVLASAPGDFFTDVLQKLPRPLVALLAFEQALRDGNHSPDDDEEHNQLLATIADATSGWTKGSKGQPSETDPWPAGQGAALVELYRKFAQQNGRAMIDQLRAQALLGFDSTFAREGCGHMADYYSAVEHRRAYQEAHYLVRERELREQETGRPPRWAQASVERVAAALLELSADTPIVYSARARRIADMAQKVLSEPFFIPSRERLYALIGDCKAYLGRFHDAAEAYTKARTLTPDDDPFYPHLLARLLRAYQELEDPRAERIAFELRDRTDPSNPLQALWHIYRSQVDDDHVVEHLGAAIALLEASRAQWGHDSPVLAEELVRLQDERAIAIHLAGDSDGAIRIQKRLIREATGDGQLRQNSALIARLENNLGCFLYYGRESSGDATEAEDLFTRALETRKQVGDVLGALRAAQNLFNVRMSLASSATEWEAAASFFAEHLKRAIEVQAANRSLIFANYLDALVTRGAFEQAHQLVQRLDQEKMDHYTRKALLLNRAKLRLWQGDLHGCAADLAAAEPIVAQADTAIDRIEWIQLTLERSLLAQSPDDRLDPQLEPWLQAAKVDSSKRALDGAEWHLAAGLLALAQRSFPAAHEQLQQSARLWKQMGFHYRLGVTMIWQVEALAREGKPEAARTQAGLALQQLAPFGDIPASSRLKRREEQADA
jgi:hypothetical protein